jgi:broad specificity phosphatase PhoE
MKIIFVRHGESKYNARLTDDDKDPSLTRKGEAQVKQVGNSLKKQEISAIYTSNLLRAKQTGEIISKIIHVPVKGTFEELDEYSHKILRSRIRLLVNKRFKRLKKLLNKISKDKLKDKTIIIVAHGITNKIIFGYLMHLPLRKPLLRFRQHNTGVHTLHWSKTYKNWSVDSMNDISHLPKKLITEPHI